MHESVAFSIFTPSPWSVLEQTPRAFHRPHPHSWVTPRFSQPTSLGHYSSTVCMQSFAFFFFLSYKWSHTIRGFCNWFLPFSIMISRLRCISDLSVKTKIYNFWRKHRRIFFFHLWGKQTSPNQDTSQLHTSKKLINDTLAKLKTSVFHKTSLWK